MKKKFDLTTDKALIFSAVMLTIFTIVMIVVYFMFQSVPDSLVVAFFGAFGLEGGYCAFIHKIKKEAQKQNGVVPDEPDDNDLVLDIDDDLG